MTSGFLRARLQSLAFAAAGLRALLQHEPNARIHAAATLAVIALAAALGLSAVEWALLALAVGGVWCAEALNTALECLCDVASPGPHELIRRAKDVAAAAVLVASMAALAVGALVFMPHLVALWQA